MTTFDEIRGELAEIMAAYPVHRVTAIEAASDGGPWVLHLERWCDLDGVPELIVVAGDARPAIELRVVSLDGVIVDAEPVTA